jgi:peptidoglycan-associated lipoprotein
MRIRRAAPIAVVLACAAVGASLAACSSRQTPEPKQYELGSPLRAESGNVAGFSARTGDTVYFSGDSSALSAAAKSTLRRQAAWLRQHPAYQVTIEGHADEWGTLQHNLSLGAARAVAVRDFLARSGLEDRRIQTVSFGKERLVADCTALSCRAKNRRARTVLLMQTAAR